MNSTRSKWVHAALRATGQWALWILANLVGFFNAWALGRGFGLTLGEELGADIGDDGILELGLELGSPAGALAFVLVFSSTLTFFHWPVLRTWGETGRRVHPSRVWIWVAFSTFFVVSFLVGTVLVGWIVAPRVAPILTQPLSRGLVQGFWLALLWAYVRRRLLSIGGGERLWWLGPRTRWVLTCTLLIAAVVAFAVEPWIGGERCAFCGAVPAAGVGIQFGALSGVVLLWQFRPRKELME